METELHEDCEKLLFSAEEIASGTRSVAALLDEAYRGTTPVAVCVLKGAVFFFCDLLRAMRTPAEIEFLRASSYRRGATSGTLYVDDALSFEPRGRDILLVEDIVDSGKTLRSLKASLLERGAKSVKTVTLLDKPSARKVSFEVDYKVFDVGAGFVVGYGMDYAEKYRNLPYIALLKPAIYGG